MICGRYKCACAPRSKPFTCKCRQPRERSGPRDYFKVDHCSKCKSPLSLETNPGGGTSVLETRIALTEVTPPDVRAPVLKGQKRLF